MIFVTLAGKFETAESVVFPYTVRMLALVRAACFVCAACVGGGIRKS